MVKVTHEIPGELTSLVVIMAQQKSLETNCEGSPDNPCLRSAGKEHQRRSGLQNEAYTSNGCA